MAPWRLDIILFKA